MKPRTLRIGDTVIVVDRVRGVRLEKRRGESYTLVFVEDVSAPFSLHGDHVADVREAVEGWRRNDLVILESPYAGNIETNLAYARAAMRDSLLKAEYPLASHLLYTQAGVLDDDNPDERELGIEAGLAWGAQASRSVVYVDYGVSAGMERGIAEARARGREVVFRKLGGWPCAR